MENGFTGINFEQIDWQLHIIYNNYHELMQVLTLDFQNFFAELRKKWASQNAYDFSKACYTAINDYFISIREYYAMIIDDIKFSTKKYASSTGSSWRSNIDVSKIYELSSADIMLNVLSETGTIGMDILAVDNLLNSTLNKIHNDAISIVNDLPSTISLYDNDGEQVKLYSVKKQKVIDVVDEILSIIETMINTEICSAAEAITSAKQQVVQNMNGSSANNA